MQTDNSIAIAVSLAVVVAFQQWKQRSDASKLYRLGRMALVALATGGAAFATSYAVQSYNNAKSRKNQIDNIMAQAIKSPFIGAILADEPQYQQKLRAAIALNNGSGRALIADMRNRYAKPTFWAASDDAIMAAFDESAKMRDDLAQQSLRLCS